MPVLQRVMQAMRDGVTADTFANDDEEAVVTTQDTDASGSVAPSDLTSPVLGAVNVHHGVSCDACEMDPICGVRYACRYCPQYDLCERCVQHAVQLHDCPMGPSSRRRVSGFAPGFRPVYSPSPLTQGRDGRDAAAAPQGAQPRGWNPHHIGLAGAGVPGPMSDDQPPPGLTVGQRIEWNRQRALRRLSASKGRQR